MTIGESYYQFTPGQYETISNSFGPDVAALLSYDQRYGIYYATEDSDFGTWIDENLGELLDIGIEVDLVPFSPNSGEGAGDG
ncbi:MAG: hypothetical protein IKS21_05785 [Oscillospiraceae bacterium]|nr:hypothetical protein [Oscillospiraceae bacterium]